jgi:fructuronate reductase
MARIANTAIRHRCHQIGTDGSQKIVQRLLDPLRERLAADQTADLLTLAVAGWIAYVLAGARRFGKRWTPSDPWSERIIASGERAGEDFEGLAKAVLSIEAIFAADLATPPLAAAIGAHLRGLLGADPRGHLADVARPPNLPAGPHMR